MKRLTIGALAKAGESQVTTIRYYERAGLMPVPQRSGGTHRVYADEHVRRLRFIRRARQLGFTIAEIKMLLQLADSERTSCGEVQRLATAHLQKIHAKIATLVQLEKILAHTLAGCSARPNASCPVLDWLQTPELSSELLTNPNQKRGLAVIR